MWWNLITMTCMNFLFIWIHSTTQYIQASLCNHKRTNIFTFLLLTIVPRTLHLWYNFLLWWIDSWQKKKSRSLRKNTRLLKRQTRHIHHQSDLTWSTLNWTTLSFIVCHVKWTYTYVHNILLPPLNIFNLYESCMFSN